MAFIVRRLGITDYHTAWRDMQAFTASRDELTLDEVWLTEHHPIYTLGLNRKGVMLPRRSDIGLIEVDRGGKITYHGPGQVITYLLIDLNRLKINVRQLVTIMEKAILKMLSKHGIEGNTTPDAPGVYIMEKKIASLGLRLKNMCCYHGLSLNVNMDLTPFDSIDPCGYKDMKVTQISDLTANLKFEEAGEQLLFELLQSLESLDKRINA